MEEGTSWGVYFLVSKGLFPHLYVFWLSIGIFTAFSLLSSLSFFIYVVSPLFKELAVAFQSKLGEFEMIREVGVKIGCQGMGS